MKLLDHPVVLLAVSLLLLWTAVQIGAFIARQKPVKQEQRDDLTVVTNASLTLLALMFDVSPILIRGYIRWLVRQPDTEAWFGYHENMRWTVQRFRVKSCKNHSRSTY